MTRPSFLGGYHPTLKLSGIPTFTFIVSLTHRMDNFYMFALLEIARIYKALKRFADLQGPICYNDAQNKGMKLLVY